MHKKQFLRKQFACHPGEQALNAALMNGSAILAKHEKEQSDE